MGTVKDRDLLRRQLTAEEGYRQKPYDDATGRELARGDALKGKLTIGVGRNLTDVGLTHGEVDILLEHDMDVAIADCQTFAWFDELDAVRQAAVVDLRFNVGSGGFRLFKHFIAAMARKDYVRAGQELTASSLPKARALALRQMIENGE